MTLDYAVCPHCGCRCEDDDYCAGCGRLFDEDGVPARHVSLLDFFRSALQTFFKKREGHPAVHDSIEDDPDFDPSWSFLSSNIYNDDD